MKVKQEKNNVKEKRLPNEKYLATVFSILKKRDGIVVSSKKTHFNDTELRLLGEVMGAQYAGTRLISTQIAKRLGITRSAVSQIVNRLEAQGVVRRLPDAVDRKIAYVEVTEIALERYREDVKVCAEFVGKLIEKYGEDKFQQMCSLLDEFMECVQTAKDEEKEKKNK